VNSVALIFRLSEHVSGAENGAGVAENGRIWVKFLK